MDNDLIELGICRVVDFVVEVLVHEFLVLDSTWSFFSFAIDATNQKRVSEHLVSEIVCYL